MIISLPGTIVFLLLLSFGYLLGAPLIIGLFAAMAFGSTAIATLTAVGGSSPLIYVAFAILLLIKVVIGPGSKKSLSRFLATDKTVWIVLSLVVLAICGAIVLPRMFAGATSVFVFARTPTGGRIAEVPLSPVSSNITQTGYFVLNCLTFICVALLLQRRDVTLSTLRQGFFVFAWMNLLLGLIDLLGKMAHAGDVLGPIRTASYSMLVAIEHGGFWRIVGGFPEASSFATATLVSLAFTTTYWRTTKSQSALFLSVGLLVLLALSTSSSGYAAGALLAVLLAGAMLFSFSRSLMTRKDLAILTIAFILVACALFFYLYDEKRFDPVARLLDSAIWNKAQSGSAQERAYWNAKSIASFFDTYGIGIGMGSSRASSWIVAVISQLGLIGAVLVGYLVVEALRPLEKPRPQNASAFEVYVLALSIQASVLAGIIVSAMIGGSADPGLLFFVSLAVIGTCRKTLSRSVDRQPSVRSQYPVATSNGRQRVPL